MAMTSTSYEISEPAFFLLGSGVEEPEVDLAIDFVADEFDLVVPEPSGLTLMGALVGMAWFAVRCCPGVAG